MAGIDLVDICYAAEGCDATNADRGTIAGKQKTTSLQKWLFIETMVVEQICYMAANCTFCCSSITFSLNILSVSIKSFTVWQEWITVV